MCEPSSKRAVAFLGQEFSQPRVVLELSSTKRVFVEWVHQTPELRVAVDRKPSVLAISDPFPADPMVAEREALAVSARDAAGVSEFRISGFLRTSWYEAQRKDPSLAGNIRRPEAPFKISGDGVLEREVTQTWVSKCLSCIKGRSRPTNVKAKLVKCLPEACLQEVSIDCEGPNREDREGYRYSIRYFCCLSHAVLLEPMRSLTRRCPQGLHEATP